MIQTFASDRRPTGDPTDVVACAVLLQSSVVPITNRSAHEDAIGQTVGGMLDANVRIEASDVRALGKERQQWRPMRCQRCKREILPEDTCLCGRMLEQCFNDGSLIGIQAELKWDIASETHRPGNESGRRRVPEKRSRRGCRDEACPSADTPTPTCSGNNRQSMNRRQDREQ